MNPLRSILKRLRDDLILLANPDTPPLPLSRLTRLHLVLGLPCNCRCCMCYQEDFKTLMEPQLRQVALRPLFPHLKEIILQGGEPTILPQSREFADEVLQANPALRFGLFTNGHRFDRSWSDFMCAHGSMVHFSLNAATENTYHQITRGETGWPQLLETIRDFNRARQDSDASPRLETSMVILEENLSELSAFLELSRELGADTAEFFFDPSRLPSDKAAIAAAVESARAWCAEHPAMTINGLAQFSHWVLGTAHAPQPCSWPFDSLYVEVNGDARFCCLIHHFLGNLKHTSIGDLWNSWRARRIRGMMQQKNRRFCGHYCRPRRNRE